MVQIYIINYNKEGVRYGSLICFMGFALLLTNAIPFVGKEFALPVACTAIVLILLGSFVIIRYQNKLSNQGYIIIDEYKTRIKNKSSEIEIVNKDYYVNFSEDGYKGASNYRPFLHVGAFTSNPGINKISFFNDKKKYDFEILIDNKNDLIKVKDLTERYFRK